MFRPQGYVLLMLLLLVTIMSIGLMVAVPIWQTQMQREKEEELIFRGKQYVEAIRVYQLKHPGRFPAQLKDLLDEKCIRRLYRDPMTSHGQWNLILLQAGVGERKQQARSEVPPSPLAPTARRQPRGQGQTQTFSPQRVLVVSPGALSSVQNPQIVGVVSSSSQKSIRRYNNEDTYDKWLFYYGQDPQKKPEVIYPAQTSRVP